MTRSTPQNSTYVTLITKSSYLPGAILLAHSLQQKGSRFPLIVLITSTLEQSAIEALNLEAKYNPLLSTRIVDPLYPPVSAGSSSESTSAAARFADTYIKLRAFELVEYERVVFLDADMLCINSPDSLFEVTIPKGVKLLASPICACNLDSEKWCPGNWKPVNCPHSQTSHPESRDTGGEVPHSSLSKDEADDEGDLEPRRMLNSGVLVFEPNPTDRDELFNAFDHDPDLHAYKCPDQDFLSVLYRDRWSTIPWRFNALKTMRYWHGNIWSGHPLRQNNGDLGLGQTIEGDIDVSMLHYIVDKPWAKRIASDGIAGHMGRDGATHRWWWVAYETWRKERIDGGGEEGKREVEIVDEVVAPALDQVGDEKQCEEHRKLGWPTPMVAREGITDGAREGLARIWDGVRR